MGEAGRKLTIRMPDNPRLRSVEVVQLHVEPGERVPAGTPVLSLHKRRRDHIVRSPRPGRIVPLVAIGDTVEPGDPLYILHLDEQALIAHNRADKELVAIEQAKWSNGVTPEVIEPIARARVPTKPSSRVAEFAIAWGKPVLAIALYVLACFALLPILHTFGEGASTLTLFGMCVGSVLFGALIYFLYAPNAGPGPRWAVRLVATSWVAISAVAIFYRPPVDEDITLAEATARIEALFATEAPKPLPPPQDVDVPVTVAASGVQVGVLPVSSSPDWAVPESVLAEAATTPAPHGVSVRGWARVNPTNRAGEVLSFEQGDGVPPVGALLASQDRTAMVLPSAPLPDTPNLVAADLGALPQIRSRVTVTAALPAPDLVPPAVEASPLVATLSVAPSPSSLPGLVDNVQSVLLAAAPVATLSTESWLRVAGLPVPLTDGSDPQTGRDADWPGLPASAAPRHSVAVAELSPTQEDVVLTPMAAAEPGGWLARHGVPVALSDRSTVPPPTAQDWIVAVSSTLPERGGLPSRLAFSGAPDLLLMGAIRAGEGEWMAMQAALLAALPETSTPSFSASAPGSVAALSEPKSVRAPDQTLSDTALAGLVRDRAELAERQVGETPLQIARPSQERALELPARPGQPIASGYPDSLQLATLPQGIPALPSSAPELVSRLLLFVYFDDPRLTSHPGVGDAWAAPVSPQLYAAVHASDVVAEKQIVQVERWCDAASDPSLSSDAARTAWLNDRIRLLQVQVAIEADRIAAFEQEVPLFDGTPAGFFHNRAPLMGAEPGAPLLEDGMAYLRSLAAGLIDPDAGETMQGGQYFDSPVALATILRGAGCTRAEWNGGGAPDNQIGRALDQALGG